MTSHFLQIGVPQFASYAEAKARCKARGMQLPEVYSTAQQIQLSAFLKQNDIRKCFAGLEPDIPDAIHRFASTGFPIWKAIQNYILLSNGKEQHLDVIMDDFNVKFMYEPDGELHMYSVNNIVKDYYHKMGSHTYRDSVKTFPQVLGSIVCEPAWDGETLNHLWVKNETVGLTQVVNVFKRSLDEEIPKGNTSDYSDTSVDDEILRQESSKSSGRMYGDEPSLAGSSKSEVRETVTNSIDHDTLRQGQSDSLDEMYEDEPYRMDHSDSGIPEILNGYCESISLQAFDIANEMSGKLKNLLALVDISVQLDGNSRLQRSEDHFLEANGTALEMGDPHSTVETKAKRAAFLAHFIFKTGVKMIWKIAGFVYKIMTERRMVGIESKLSSTQTLAQNNTENIKKMTIQLDGNSIAIDSLRITSDDLSRRMNILERKVTSVTHAMVDLGNNLMSQVKLSLIANLITRIEQSMNTGYDTLKDIIHCSLLSQTSPLLLPLDQIEIVQNEVRKMSAGILDTDFEKMQSIVVSDPSDPHLLLVVINAAALSRSELELVTLVPIPQYENGKSFSPTLDYTAIAVDQLSRKYFILSEQEENDCMFGRCYISDIERSIEQKTCGIPQLFDQHLDACVFEESLLNNGIYLKPMLPDGVIFAFQGETATQLFCKDNTVIGPPRKLSGTGIMQLPNGCTLSVTDNFGKHIKVKGQPIYRAVIAGDVSLVINGPLKELQSQWGRNFSQKRLTADGILVNHLFPIVEQVNSVDAKVSYQSYWLWGLMIFLGLVITIIIVVIYFQFKSSKQFFRKIYDLRDKFTDLGGQMQLLRELRDRLTKGPSTPIVRPHQREAFHFSSPRRFHQHARDTHSESADPAMYLSMEHLMHDTPPAMAPPTNLSENKTILSFKLPRKSDGPISLPSYRTGQEFLSHRELDRECDEEVEALCTRQNKKHDDDNGSPV